MADHRFQVHLSGVIELLSDHLYSGPQVFVRELLQNGVDAIQARQSVDGTAAADPLVAFELIPGEGDTPPTVVCRDTGVGLTTEQVHAFLATIGRSSKREAIDDLRDQFIGQFGIGLLSCFCVAEEIVVVTRSAAEPAPAVEWRGRQDGTYTVRELDRELEPGTTVYLRAKAGTDELFDADRLAALITHYGAMLPIPITLTAEGQTTTLNQTPPWEMPLGSPEGRRACVEAGQALLEKELLDAIPLQSEAGGVTGVAYVLGHPTATHARPQHRVYLKHAPGRRGRQPRARLGGVRRVCRQRACA